MTGRKPFLSHLTGRRHIQRLSELGLNANEENRVLQQLADRAFEKKKEQKRTTSFMKRAQRYKVQELHVEFERNKTTSPTRSESSNYQSPVGISSDTHSEEDSEKSDMIIGSSSNSSSQSQSSTQ